MADLFDWGSSLLPYCPESFVTTDIHKHPQTVATNNIHKQSSHSKNSESTNLHQGQIIIV